MNFQSDNQSTIFPEIIDYIKSINNESSLAYGADNITKLATKMLKEFFETDLKVLFVSSGTAANAISLSSVCPPYGAILCSDNSHINGDECGAPEFFTGGAKLLSINTDNAIITKNNLIKTINSYGLHGFHEVLPSAISITQATELGTSYTLDQINEISTIAKQNSLKTHMDGARFSNACAFLNCTPAEMSWKNGVDILSLGTTKNGTISCEAIIIFNKDILDDVNRRQKRAGHLWSKNRYIAAQLVKWLEEDRWIKAAKKANLNAQKLKSLLQKIKGVSIEHPVEANMVFAKIPKNIQDFLKKHEVKFNPWYGPENLTRFVTSWDTKKTELEKLEKIINSI